VILALVAFAAIVLADPYFRRPFYGPFGYQRRYFGRREVDPTDAKSTEDISADVPVGVRPIPGTPAAAAPIALLQ